MTRVWKLHAALPVSFLCTLCLTILISPHASAQDSAVGKLVIAISGLETDRGFMRVALMNSADSFENDTETFRTAKVKVLDGNATAIFSDVPFGSYAVKAYHDENSNEKLDTNFVGFPTEAFGFSNDALGRFGPPSFEQARFELASLQQQIEIHTK